MRLPKASTRAPTFLLCALLVACGGGGGGDDDEGDPVDAPVTPVDSDTPVSITAENAEAVAGLTMDSALGGLIVGELGGLLLPVSEKAGAVQPMLATISMEQVTLLAELVSVSQARSLQAVSETIETLLCDDGGQVVGTLVDDDGVLSAGDSATLQFTNCGFDGYLLNGPISMVVRQVSGDPSGMLPWRAEVGISYAGPTDNLVIDYGTGSIGILGGADVAIDSGSSGDSVEVTAAPLIQFSEAEGYLTNLEPYTMTIQTSLNGDSTISGAGTIKTSYIGKLVFTVSEPLQVSVFDDGLPGSGAVQVIGADSNMVLQILNAASLTLYVDADGDGAAETLIDSSWPAIFEASEAL